MPQSSDLNTLVERLKLMRELSLLENPNETVYDRFTRIASEILGAPVSLVTMVTAGHQFFKSAVGLPEPVATERQTPLSHSLCKHVVANNSPLVVTDTRNVPSLQNNGAVTDFGVVGYLGMPLRLSDGTVLGSFCVLDMQPRTWEKTDINIMSEIADIICYEFDVRAKARNNTDQKLKLDRLHQAIDALFHEYEQKARPEKADFLLWIQNWKKQHTIPHLA